MIRNRWCSCVIDCRCHCYVKCLDSSCWQSGIDQHCEIRCWSALLANLRKHRGPLELCLAPRSSFLSSQYLSAAPCDFELLLLTSSPRPANTFAQGVRTDKVCYKSILPIRRVGFVLISLTRLLHECTTVHGKQERRCWILLKSPGAE